MVYGLMSQIDLVELSTGTVARKAFLTSLNSKTVSSAVGADFRGQLSLLYAQIFGILRIIRSERRVHSY